MSVTSETPRRPGPFLLTWYAVAQLGMSIALLALFIVWVVGGVLAVLWVGLVILVAAIPATRAIANVHRRMAARTLGSPVPDPYRPAPGGFFTRLRAYAVDPMTWRDLVWMPVAFVASFTINLVVVILALGVVTWFIWWFATPWLMRARASVDRWFLAYSRTERLEQRVQLLTETRADAVDHSAAELRRLERDLHDGAQARLVALSMSLGMAEAAFDTEDPEQARQLVRDARATTTAAIGDLRSVVRGIHPPVLADRGLSGAVEALALDMAVPVTVDARLPGRPLAPVESAVYFGVAECLANIGKHSGARNGWITLRHEDGVLRAVVGDDGRGGADPGAGTGMLGVMRRLAAFDGTLSVSSPAGGPTIITLEVPCDLSSPKTTPSSGPA
ncbi:sensor domain-containing protein [Nocardioides hankookensis]|uniref:histidine kinase n=1 Tax=Nocardioides hankookensis TaxID=443157 RepID=A0ABW1LIQ6_9ACTN